MKKLTVLIISFVFFLTNNIQASLFQAPNPYSFGPQGRAVADLRDFAKPKQMVNILAGRPVVATKSDGTRVYYTSDGKMSLSIKGNGEMTFSLGGHSKSLDKFGNLKAEAKTLKNNLQEIRNEFGEIQSYNKLDGNGKVIASYDEDMNKTATFYYGKYGKSLEYSVNEMTKQKTVYDKSERAVAVYDPEGYILSTYQYEDVSYESAEDRKTLIAVESENKGNRLLVTTKSYLNKIEDDGVESGEIVYSMTYSTTYYNGDGLVTHVVDPNGITSMIYNYKKDSDGNKVLEYVLDTKTRNKTYYENNREKYVKNDKDKIITKYYWNGSKFLFSAEVNDDGTWISTTNKDKITSYSNIVYNKDGTIDTVSDEKGNITERYHYKEDDDGNNILDYVENVLDGSKTYYTMETNDLGDKLIDKAVPVKTVNAKGEVIIDYGSNKGNLVYSFDRRTKVTSWYMPGQEDKPELVYETLNDRIMSKNIYSNGQLIGKWEVSHGHDAEGKDKIDESNAEELKNMEDRTYKLTIFVNERQEFVLWLKEEPSVDKVRYIMDKYKETGDVKFLNND